MNCPDPIPATLPWYQSKVIRGCIVTIVTILLRVTHLSKYVGTEDVSDLIDAGLTIAALLGAGYTVQARVASPVQPITLTKQPPHPPENPS